MRATTKRARRARDQRGAALIMVLLALVVLTVFLTEVQSESSTSFSAAIAARDRIKAEYHARSAINLSRLLLASEPSVRSAVGPILAMIGGGSKPPQIPVWEFADQVLGAYNDSSGSEGFASLAGVDTSMGENLGLAGTGSFEMVIVDEDSKLNVNTAARGDPISATTVASQLLALTSGPQYDEMFKKLDADGQHSTREIICSAIIDWADYNQDLEACDLSTEAQQAGVEDNFYQSIGLDYFRKNAAFDSLEELRLVRGIGDDFWATFVDPDPRKPHKRVITVWGQGKVNVNSANAQTIYGLICSDAPDHEMCAGSPNFDPQKALSFLQLVGFIRMMAPGIPLFGSANDFVKTMQGGGLLGPFLMQQAPLGAGWTAYPQFRGNIKNQITTESKIFSIYAVGVVPGAGGRETRVSIHEVVDFRNAADLAESAGLLPPDPSETPSPSGDDERPDQPNQPTLPPGAEAALQQLNQNPAGTVVYFRIQ
jgi:general secretion pathway protein K